MKVTLPVVLLTIFGLCLLGKMAYGYTKIPGGFGGRNSFLETAIHDGHKFVVAERGEAISIIHHPGCDCLKK